MKRIQTRLCSFSQWEQRDPHDGVRYALKKPRKDASKFGCNEVFHLFILLGSVFYFLFIRQCILCL